MNPDKTSVTVRIAGEEHTTTATDFPGLEPKLGAVQSQNLLLGGDARADRIFQHDPQKRAHAESEYADHEDADDLAADGGVGVCPGGDKRAPYPAKKMRRNGADDVVDLEAVENRNADRNNDAAHRADQNRLPDRRRQRFGGD